MRNIYETNNRECRCVEDYALGQLWLYLFNVRVAFTHDTVQGNIVELRAPWEHDEKVLDVFLYEASRLDEWLRKMPGTSTPRFINHATCQGTKPSIHDLRESGGWTIYLYHPEADALAEHIRGWHGRIRFVCGEPDTEKHHYFLHDYDVRSYSRVVVLSGLREPV